MGQKGGKGDYGNSGTTWKDKAADKPKKTKGICQKCDPLEKEAEEKS